MKTRSKIQRECTVFIMLLPMLISLSACCRAQCRIQIISVSVCNSRGQTITPTLLNPHYRLRLLWRVSGTPAHSYRVEMSIANQQAECSINPSSGIFSAYIGADVPMDGPIPYFMNIDPDHVSGNAGKSPTLLRGSFTPALPATAVAYYNPVHYLGTYQLTGRCLAHSQSRPSGVLVLGAPSSGSYQQVVALQGPSHASQVVQSGQPAWVVSCLSTNSSDYHSWHSVQSFQVVCSNVAVNAGLLEKISWNSLHAISASRKFWLKPDALVQSNSPLIHRYVQHVLAQHPHAALSPYTAARALFQAVVKRTVYQQIAPQPDALTTLSSRVSDCQGFSCLFAACLRQLGIPARTLCGVLTNHETHCIVEFYLPGAGWIPADPAFAKGYDPTGNYPYFFGNDPMLNTFCTLSRCNQFTVPFAGGIHLPAGSFYCKGATSVEVQEQCTLKSL